MAEFSRIKGVQNWLRKRGYGVNASQQIMSVYKKITGNKLTPLSYYANRPRPDKQFQTFAIWFGKVEKEHPVIFSEFRNNEKNINHLKEIRKQLRKCYL